VACSRVNFTWGRTMPWWQGSNHHGRISKKDLKYTAYLYRSEHNYIKTTEFTCLRRATCCDPGQVIVKLITVLKSTHWGRQSTNNSLIMYSGMKSNVKLFVSKIIHANEGVLGALVKLRKKSLLVSSYMSVRLSAWSNLALTGRIFMKFYIWILFENLSRYFTFH